jgi:hypothetical protein
VSQTRLEEISIVEGSKKEDIRSKVRGSSGSCRGIGR